MNTTLEFTEGHLSRAGEAPRNRSLRRRDIIISFRFAGVKEDLNRVRNGGQQEGKRLVFWVHEKADTWTPWDPGCAGSWRAERTTLRGHYFCVQNSGQTRKSIPSLCSAITHLGRLSLCCWVLLISKVQYHHWESPLGSRCCNSFGHSWALGGGSPEHYRGCRFSLGYPITFRNACLIYLRTSSASYIFFCGPQCWATSICSVLLVSFSGRVPSRHLVQLSPPSPHLISNQLNSLKLNNTEKLL